MAVARRKRKDIGFPGVELAGKHSLFFIFKHVLMSVCILCVWR